MEFRLLGPLEVVEHDRPLALGGRKQRSLLAVLLLHANEVVSVERLIDELWGEAPPATVAKSIQVYVSGLRKVLGEGRLVTRSPGYVLRVDPSELDVARLERLVAEASGCDPGTAAQKLREGLALWRGPPLADLAYEPFAQAPTARLGELRLAAVEQRIDAVLATGRHAELIGELEALVRDHPLRERLRGQLMLCLYRSGRQAEALETYQAARRALVGELGIEPGRRLRELHQAILLQDPGLDLRAAEEPTGERSRSELVGRGPELAALESGLDDAFAGRGRLFLLAGEPGIGKSRLAEELLALARARGARAYVGRCWEAGGAPAYWPWVQSLRGYVRGSEPEALRAQLGGGAADLAPLLPELRTLLPDLPEPAPESEGARFRLFEATSAFLRRAAQGRPLVLVLDDLHAADEPSLLLLRFVARELADSRLLVICAFRDVDPTPHDPLISALAELVREPQTARIELAGLSEPDVAEYIELSTGVQPAPQLVRAIHAGTEGNPLFVVELVRLLDAEGRIADTEAHLRIPPGVRAVIGRRVARLSEQCRSVLDSASVLGREFGLDALARLGALSRDDLLDLLDEAMVQRVVGEVPGAPGRLRFGHALIRDTLYDELTAARRLRLHRQAGEALEAVYAADPGPHLAELAHHFFSAAGAGAAGEAVEYARRAGDRAAAELAYEEAVRLYGLALDALGPDGASTQQARGELLVAMADAQARGGDGPGAKATLLQAAELGRSAGLPELLARAALSYGGRFLWARAASDERLVPLLEDALSALGEGDSVLRVQLLSRLAAALRGETSRGRRERVCDEAVQTARRIGDPATLAYALDGAEASLHAPDTAELRLAEAGEIVSLASRIGDRERVFDGHEHAYWAAWELGKPDRRAHELDSMTQVAEELRQPAQLWMAAVARAVLALAEGRLAEAEVLSEQAATAGERTMSWSAAETRRLQLFMLRREQGRLGGFDWEVRDFAHEFPSPLVHRSVLTYVCARSERTAEAEATLRELTSHDLSDWHVDEEWLVSICLLAEACAILGDTERARPLYELLLPYRSHTAIAVPEVALDSVSRPLGILATLLRRFADAERHFDDALRMNTRMGAKPWVAHTEHDYAHMLAARDQPGDRRRALELTARALEGYRSLSMDTFSAEVAQLDRALKAAPAARPDEGWT
jgi:DNA-binding SARP family transcriptional activator/tetratricopeptide (TPR) repeat protein